MDGTSCLTLSGRFRVWGRQVFIDLPAVWPELDSKTITLLTRAAPPDVLLDANQIAHVAGVNLRLAVVDDLGGIAGLHVPGLVVLGLADCARISHRIWTTRIRPSTSLERVLVPEQLVRRDDLASAVRRCVLAHEVGHAMRTQRCFGTPYEDEELAADYLAGQISAVLGWRPDLGRVVFQAFGCAHFPCDHPNPDDRADAYASGYAALLAPDIGERAA
jgi:hypothetical protein